MTLEPFDWIELFTLVLGGSGCGLSVTLDPGDTTDPDFAFLPPTMMIDLSLPDRLGPTVEDCANAIFEAACLRPIDVSEGS